MSDPFLKHCPFCGSEDTAVVVVREVAYFHVGCHSCGCGYGRWVRCCPELEAKLLETVDL